MPDTRHDDDVAALARDAYDQREEAGAVFDDPDSEDLPVEVARPASTVVSVRLNQQELAAIEAAATAAGSKLSTWIKYIALQQARNETEPGAYPRAAAGEIAELHRSMGEVLRRTGLLALELNDVLDERQALERDIARSNGS